MTSPVGISYSGGKSSKWMIHAMIRGVIPRPEQVAVFFADTKAEHDWTYEDVAETEDVCQREGIAFFRCGVEEGLGAHLFRMRADGLTRADHPPFYVKKDDGSKGQIMHRCTRQFKVSPMRRAQSQWLKSLGSKKQITKWVGFAHDELARAMKAESKRDVQWEKLDFPIIRAGATRARQAADLAAWGVNVPRFSMCVFCPWKSDLRWHATPERQRRLLVHLDEAVRDMSNVGITQGDVYISDRLIPVSRLLRERAPATETELRVSGCDSGHCFL